MLKVSIFLFVLLAFVSPHRAQVSQRPTSISVLEFGQTPFAKLTADQIDASLRKAPEIILLDPELGRAAAKGIGYSGSLNMSVTEARDLGAAIASDYYVIGDAQTLRRSSSRSPAYYESYCSIFIVSSRTGQLVFWERPSFENATAAAAEQQLLQHLAAVESRGRWLAAIRQAAENERSRRALIIEGTEPLIEAPDDDKTAAAQGLRLPRPYRRLRPDYPESAARAEAEATVDVVVDVGSDGEVSQVQIARWGGFGLDETTVATVRQMHFFPAARNGTPIPMRVLLRYNFRKPPR